MGGIWQWPDGRDLPDNFEMICEYPRGMTVYVLGTMSNRVGLDHVIRGYRGTMYFTDKGWVVRDKDGKILDEHVEKQTHREDMHNHHTNFHNHLRHGEPLNCPVELGMAAVVAVNMANESWRLKPDDGLGCRTRTHGAGQHTHLEPRAGPRGPAEGGGLIFVVVQRQPVSSDVLVQIGGHQIR